MTVELTHLRWIAVTLLTAGMTAFVYVALCAPSRAPRQLGIRGLKRQRALQDPSWRRLDPMVRWLGERVSGLLSEKQQAAIDRQLVLAGDYLGLSASEYFALGVIAVLLGLAAGLVATRVVRMGAILILACACFGAAVPYMIISEKAEKRIKWIGRRLPSVIDLIALAMGAGLDFPGAVRQVVEKASDPYDPLIEELGWILHKLGLGCTRRQALEEFAERAPTDVVLEFVGAVSQAEERGHPLARVLQVQASTSRERRSVRAEESAAKAGVALAGPLVLLFLSILLLIMAPMVLRVSGSGILRE